MRVYEVDGGGVRRFTEKEGLTEKKKSFSVRRVPGKKKKMGTPAQAQRERKKKTADRRRAMSSPAVGTLAFLAY